jgi:opacity protein-like surface antigen
MRAYFAPVNRMNETPTIFDPGLCGVFPLDLGWIENFERSYDTPTDAVRSGALATTAMQFRGPLEARVAFDFREWGKLQMALAGGSEHMNVLAPASASVTPVPSGGTPAAAVAVLAGSTASQLVFGAGVGAAFTPGCLVAVDLDYRQRMWRARRQ